MTARPDGGFTNNDRDVRRFAIRTVVDQLDLPAAWPLSTSISSLWSTSTGCRV
jgi:hypothetical protein